MDARQRRSRERLHAAVLRLAEETPVADLSVTAVADAAEVHRSTFYEHAASLGDLLRDALTAELDAIRAGHLADPGTDLADAMRRTTYDVAAHVARHAATYRRGLAPEAGPGSLVTMLAEHFLASALLLRQQGRLDVDDAGASFVAFGTVGVVRVWLGTSGSPDPDAFLALDDALLPAWWGTGSGAGLVPGDGPTGA
jgi:AcrR family transcriptional regulator